EYAMQGTYNALVNYKGAEFSANVSSGASIMENSVTERRMTVALGEHRTETTTTEYRFAGVKLFERSKTRRWLSLYAGPVADAQGDSGMWIPYQPKQAIYGYATDGETWAASGPFSGCDVEIGTHAGRIYFAHLSRESGSKAAENWDAGVIANSPDTQVWLREKVPLASDRFYASSYIFVAWSAGAVGPRGVQVTRLDIKTKSMSGDSGTVFNVVKLVG
ncbi:MAG: hypothetical protein KGK09_07550, partial [Burkholderiales bacterium]|nr:hypothetical protein [Burkholderiales bacterium]